jgi:hypothetical protein
MKDMKKEPSVRLKPASGYISREFSNDELLYTPTMNDFRTHDGIDITGDIGSPVSAFADAQNATVIDELWNAFDYFAADLTHCTGGEVDAAEQISGELGQMLYYLLRYNARVLLPYPPNTDELSSIISAVNDSGSENIQIMPQSNT